MYQTSSEISLHDLKPDTSALPDRINTSEIFLTISGDILPLRFTTNSIENRGEHCKHTLGIMGRMLLKEIATFAAFHYKNNIQNVLTNCRSLLIKNLFSLLLESREESLMD